MKVKKKKCRVCGTEFTPFFSTTVVCNNLDCARVEGQRRTAKQEAKRKRIEKKQTREAWLALQPKSYWLKELQNVFNRYIRLRDANLPCISCQRFHTGQYHAGHYKSVGSSPALRFEESNVHKQCSACNNYKSGNLIDYRVELIKKIGEDGVSWLEGHHEPKHYTIPELQELIKHYKQKCKELAE